VEAAARRISPKILEIGPVPFMWQAFPDTTEFYSNWSEEITSDPESGRQIVSLGTLPRLARRLADPSFDLVAVHAPPFRPWGYRALVRGLFRRSMLSGNVPIFRGLSTVLLRFPVAAPIAVLDLEDATTIVRDNRSLLDKATLYFKRELPNDHWRVFAGTAHWRVPTPRFRAERRNRERIRKLRPLSLGLSFEVSRHDFSAPGGKKTTDVFFAGRIGNSSTVRERGLAELLALRQQGYAIDVSDAALPLEEYLARCRRAYLVWSPEGFGWQCFRTYEAAICGSAPLCNRSGIERYRPLIDGVHAIYYDVEPGELTRTVTAALADRERLRAIGAAAREHVRAFHTHAAIARHIVDTTAEIAARSAMSATDCAHP
jgi:glycosyltransferase involved in cell wall biosynthesis